MVQFGHEIVHAFSIKSEEEVMGQNVEMHMPKEFLDSFTLFIELYSSGKQLVLDQLILMNHGASCPATRL